MATHEELRLASANLDIEELKQSLREMMSLVRSYTYTIAIPPQEMQQYKRAERLL